MSQNPASGKTVLTSPLSVSLTEAERETVRHAAFLSRKSVSAFMRAAGVREAERVLRKSEQPVLKATG